MFQQMRLAYTSLTPQKFTLLENHQCGNRLYIVTERQILILININLEEIGPLFENDPIFPERVNTEFVTVLNEKTIKMRVWERGSGETWACSTGACAVAVAACENGFCKKGDDIKIKLKGGDLIINYTDDTVYMTGNAEKVYEGEVEV